MNYIYIILCDTLKGAVEAQEPTKSLSDARLDDSTLDLILSSGKDIHSAQDVAIKEKSEVLMSLLCKY